MIRMTTATKGRRASRTQQLGHTGSRSAIMVDKRGKLDASPFDYRELSDGRIFIYWNDKHIKTIKGDDAAKLLAKIADADEKAVQVALAKITGNFKHGNERK